MCLRAVTPCLERNARPGLVAIYPLYIICFVHHLVYMQKVLERPSEVDRYAWLVCVQQVAGDITLDCFPRK